MTDTNVDTLTTFIMRECRGDRELAVFMNAMQLSFKFIVRAVRKAGIADLYGLANTQNSSGDDVKKLDLLSDEIMIDALVSPRFSVPQAPRGQPGRLDRRLVSCRNVIFEMELPYMLR